MNLENKSALVLGAIKGIGKEIALSLARAGAATTLSYFDWQEHLPALRADMDEIGRPYQLLETDLCDPQQAQQLVAAAVERFGRIDILINNIERGGWPIVHGPYTPSQWDLEMTTTLRAKWWVFNAALPHLKASGDGAVINISSIAGMVGRSGPASVVFNDGYAAANRAISAFTETWARLGAPEVRVNEIMLGFFDTRHGPGTRGWGLLSADEKQSILNHTLMRRTGTPADVVQAVRFLLVQAPYMTGSVLRLDGGYVLGGAPVAPMPPGVI